MTDPKYNFRYIFDKNTGFYYRSGILNEFGQDTGKDPFMASFPHLIDIGIMGHCTHGMSGLCERTGVQCYQSGAKIAEPNMSVSEFESIMQQCTGKTQQVALGGRGDPNQHEEFEQILKLCKQYDIVPNYTTSGLGLTEEQVKLTKEYCGAVAVSWYRTEYSISAIKAFLERNCKTNIHYVLSDSTINEAIDILENSFYIDGINALIFLTHKPIGQGSRKECLDTNDPRVQYFCSLLNRKHQFKIGFDSCSVPMLINYGAKIDPTVIDTCEGGRFSCYISNRMIMSPCSFDRDEKYGINLKKYTIQEAWNSAWFKVFRHTLENACPACPDRELCMGGCPLTSIALCDRKYKQCFIN